MKRLFAVTLLIVLLCQALPVEALASVGRVLTDDELARAFALTGLETDGLAANGDGAYHAGMKPNAGWTARKLRGWLDEKLDQDLNSACDVLSQAFYTLSEMQQNDPAKYRRFTENSQYTNALSMQLQAEKLREEMRYCRDQLKEASGVIAEMSRWLKEERSSVFDSDAVRYSARISEAQSEIVQIRAAILENSDAWESEIAGIKHYLQYGPSENDHRLGVGEWMETLLKDDEPVVKTTALTRTSASGSLANRLQMASGLLGDADAQITVYSDNEVAIQLQAESGGELVPVDGATVMVRDALDPNSQWEGYDYQNGVVLVPINKLTADKYDVFHLGVDIDPTGLGYQHLVFDDLDLERGTLYNCLLTPLGGSAANADGERPYPYKMSFASHDIMKSEYDMVYSIANDYEIDVSIGIANADDIQSVKMRYYDYDGNACDVDPTSQSGDVYFFKGPWKQRFYPSATKEQRPAFIITDSAGDQTFPSKLVSVKSATDEPLNEGTGPDGGVFANVLGTFTGSFTIPVVDITFSLNLPLPEYIPKVSINPGGYIVLYMGSSALTNEVHKEAISLWKSKDMKEYKRAQKQIEEEDAFAKYEAQYDMAKEFYKEKKFKCLAEFSLDVGMYGVISGRWDLFDNDDEDILSKVISLRGGIGMTFTLNASWAFYPIPAVPLLYVAVTVGLSVGYSMNMAVDLCWVNGEFREWSLRPVNNFTVDIGIILALQLGVGIKDFLEGYVKGWASLDVIFSLNVKDPDTITIVGVAGFTVGVNIFFLSITRPFAWDKQFYPPESAGSLLRHYMNAGDGAPRKLVPGYGEPQSYPELAVEAWEETCTINDYGNWQPAKMIWCNGNLFAFTIFKATGADGKQHNRVGYHHIDLYSGVFAAHRSLQEFIDRDESGNHNVINQRDDYDFDICSADGKIFVLATAAKEFDEDGYPVRNDMSSASYNNRDLNQIAWMIILDCSSDGELSYCRNTLHCQSFQWNKDAPKVEYSYDSLGKPHISFARYYKDSDDNPDHEMYGEIGRVSYPDDPNPVGTTGIGFNFNYSTSVVGPFLMYPDKSVKSGMGDGYEFIKTYSLMDMDARGRIDPVRVSYVNMYSMSFVGLSRPKDGAEGDNALELFAFGMNDGDRRAIVLDQGDISNIVAMKDPDAPEGERAGTTVFYTLGETNGDGATQYRLCSVHIGPVTGQGTPDLEYDVTRYEYDAVLPASDFDICRLGSVPYLYWTNTATKKQDSDPDVWRTWTMPYDSITNSLGSPAVFTEFTLPKLTYCPHGPNDFPRYYDEHPTLKNVMVLSDGTVYANAVFADLESIPEEERPRRMPHSVCRISGLLTPSAKMISAVPKEMVVKAGSFDDFSLDVMNDGNLAITAFDLAMYEVTGSGDEKLVETAHIDALDPTRNAITMADGTVVQSGESAGYRNEDYDNTSRRHDWVLDREALAYKLHVADGKTTVDKQTIEPSDPQHITTDVMMPGSVVGYTVPYKIPDDWEGGVKELRIKVTSASTFSNWMRAAALAAGARANGTVANANANGELVELKYVLSEQTGKLELQKPAYLTASLKEALQSGLIAREFEAGSVPVAVEVHDLEVDHRIYEGLGGERWLDIIVRNHAATREGLKLVCAVYVDGAKEPYYINLPYYEKAALAHRTQTISLPVSALVDDPDAHRMARVEIMAVGRDERAYANNGFSLYLGGSDPLRFVRQPEDMTVQEGEDVSFEVEVAGGKQPCTYRWQVCDPRTGKWVELKGYDQPAISRKSIEKKWDGCRFRCVVTDASGTQIISREATLSVRDLVDTGDHTDLPLYSIVAVVAILLLIVLRRRRGMDR